MSIRSAPQARSGAAAAWTRRMAVLSLVPVALRANSANGNPRLEQLFGRFIAPCCWRENLLIHQSPKADELRAQIRKDVEAGRSDADIQQALVGQYTTRILAMPEGTKQQWLQWTPLAAGALGLTGIWWFVQRSIAKHRQTLAETPLTVTTASAATLPVDLEDL